MDTMHRVIYLELSDYRLEQLLRSVVKGSKGDLLPLEHPSFDAHR
jgi:hypothetical protein